MKHGSAMHTGGSWARSHFWPVGQPWVLHEASTQVPTWHVKPPGHLTMVHGSMHCASPFMSILQLKPGGQLAFTHLSGMHRFEPGSQRKPPGQGNSPPAHSASQLPW